MAKVKLYNALWDYTDWSDFFHPEHQSYVTNSGSKSFAYKPYSDIRVEIAGNSFSYDKGGKATGGTIQSVKVYYHGDLIVKMTDVGQKLAEFYNHAFGKKANGPDALAVLFKGKNKFIGEDGGDIMPAGPANGKDKIFSGKGDDVVNGDHGDDRLDGGEGYDLLTYQPRYQPTGTPKGAFAGIVLDVALGTVTDPWGHKDTISNFEAYHGSNFDDVMNGSAGNEEFTGNKGADLIDGRMGFDTLFYAAEAFYGGMGGIDANLLTGKIRDAFGTVDTVANIEVVIGTAKNDNFVGGDQNDIFEGLGGIDRFDGGAGDHDQVSFFLNERSGATAGVNVDLASGVIFNDGFGNGEYAFGIEDVRGSTLADLLVGDAQANRLLGEAGNDWLEGRNGHDNMFGGSGADRFVFTGDMVGSSSDTIGDFSAAEGDTIGVNANAIGLAGYAGLPVPGFAFISGSDATTPNQRLIYDKLNGNFYFDTDGSGGAPKVLIAHFDSNPAIVINDIFLI